MTSCTWRIGVSAGKCAQVAQVASLTLLLLLPRADGTFCSLAGVEAHDARAAAAGLPAVDSKDLWPLLSAPGGSAPAPRTLPLSPNTIIVDGWKLIVGMSTQGLGGPTSMDGWTGPICARKPKASGRRCLLLTCPALLLLRRSECFERHGRRRVLWQPAPHAGDPRLPTGLPVLDLGGPGGAARLARVGGG